jgi:prevent-host-death family protein
MASVNVTGLRRHLPDYLRQVQQGKEIAITLHGNTIARIVPEHGEKRRDAALKRLQALRGTITEGIPAPLDED